MTEPTHDPRALRGTPPSATGNGWLRRLGAAFRASRAERKAPAGPASLRDPVESALARIRQSDPDSIEAAVARGALEIPGVLGGILFEVGDDGRLLAVAAAGPRPPDEASAREAADLSHAPPGSPILAVSLPRWGSAPAYRFALAVERAATPAALVDRIERFARLAAPYLAAGAGERRGEETRTRLEQARREISEARRSAREAVVDALLGRIAGRVCAELADPLGSVLGCARSLSETTEDRARATLVDDLLEASARGCRIVEHLAAVCALEPSGDWGPFPPRPVLLEAAEECDRELRETGSRVAIRVEADLPPIEGSRALLRFSIGHALRALARRPDGAPRSLSFEADPTAGGVLVRASVVGEEHAAPNSGPGMESERLSWSIAEEVWKELGARVERDVSSLRLVFPGAARSEAAGS